MTSRPSQSQTIEVGDLLVIRRDVSFGQRDDTCVIIDVKDLGVTSKVYLLTQQGTITRYKRTLQQLISNGLLELVVSET